MRPSRPYHAVTAYHREPGGLRRLDFFVDRIMRRVAERNPSGYKILDVGCGNGNIAIPLAVMGFDVTGIDLSDASIKACVQAAQEVGVKASFLAGGIEAATDQYDAIICSEVLEHQSDPKVLLTELKKKLRPGGVLLLSVPNGQSLEERSRRFLNHTRLGLFFKNKIKKVLGQGMVQSSAQDPHIQFYSYSNLTKQLRESGFWIMASENAAVWFKEFFYLIGRAWMKRGGDIFHRLDSLDNVWSGYWPRLTADGWLLELEAAHEGKLVVQLIPTLGLGGAERIVMCLAERLTARGFSVVTLAHINGGELENEFLEKRLPCTVILREGFLKRWKNFWALRRALIDLAPTWVHTHLFGSDFWGRLAARSAGLKNIATTEHNLNADFSLWRNLALIFTRSLSLSYVAISKQVNDYLIRKIRVPEKKIHLIYNGVDLKRIKPRVSTSLRDIPKMIFVGRLEQQKNPEFLLRCLAPIKQPWELTLVGEGTLSPKLKSLAEELKIAPRLRFLGLRTDVPDLLAQHDFFLFPSLWEGFGLSVVEAAAAGVPVLTSDLPVLRELFNDEQVTFLPPNDLSTWTKAIESALANPAPWLAKARHAAASDWSRFSDENMADEYAKLYV